MYNSRAYRDTETTDYLKSGIIVSLLIHLALVAVLSRSPINSPLPEKVIEISLIPDIPKPPRSLSAATQMVTPPEQQPVSEPNPETRYLSDENFSTEKEQIRRGDDPNAGPVQGTQRGAVVVAPPSRVQKPQTPPAKPREARQEKPPGKEAAAQPGPKPPPQELSKAPLRNLLLDDKTLLEKFSTDPKPAEQRDRNPLGANRSPGNYEAFSRPQGSGAALIGFSGSNDYLPHLPDGDITLLNTKANRFAVFVRRVATQVFAEMRRSGWENLRAGDINQITDYTEVRAVLSPDGKLLRIKIESSSGSTKFDSVLQGAVKTGAQDPNPPAEAKAEDGNFHFIFKSKSWSRLAHNARTGAPFERRWLLLATGLE